MNNRMGSWDNVQQWQVKISTFEFLLPSTSPHSEKKKQQQNWTRSYMKKKVQKTSMATLEMLERNHNFIIVIICHARITCCVITVYMSS